jgi:outer membrane autotransporter protein
MEEIFKMSDAKDVAAAYESLSPDSYTGATAASGQSAVQYMRTLGTRMQGIRSSGISSGSSLRSDIQSDKTVLLAYNASDASIAELFDSGRRKNEPERYGVWLDGFGSWGDQGADPGYTGFDYNVAGGALGVDFLLRDRFIIGISGGYSYTNIDLDDNKGNGSTRSSFGSIYGSYFTSQYYLETAFSYARQDYNNTRNVDVGALHSQAYSKHRGDTYSFSLTGGYNFTLDRWLVQPLASLRYTYLGEEGFQEHGAGGASLIVGDRDSESLVSELGLRLARIFETRFGAFIPELRAAWNYDFGLDDRVITAAFAGSPNATFAIKGQEVKNHGATLGTGITLVQKNGFSTSLKYDAELREDYNSHGFFGEIRYSF